MIIDDMELVRRYARSNSEEAFATLVSRYVNLVYSVALRQVHDAHLAEEITQTVFIILSRKAKSLSPKTIICGWLCRTARYASAKALTMERRRQDREQKAYMQSTLNEPASDAWMQIAPVLETAMAQLGEKDHDAVALRFFENRNFKEVSASLGTTEAGAKMRVNRALEKLRKIFRGRGLILSCSAIAAALSANSIQAAPIGLAASATAAALKGATVSASTITLIKSTLKIMTWTNFKTAAVIGGIFLVAGTATVVIRSGATPPDAAIEGAKKSPFTFAGYDTPDNAFQSFLWALGTGDLGKVLAACTPEQRERFKKKMEGKSADEVRREMIAWASHMVGFQLAKKEVQSDEEVRLLLQVPPYPGHPNVGNDLQVLKKVENEWKYAGKWGVDIKED